MPIPTGSYYQKKALGNGTVSTTEGNTINTIGAAEEIGFGCAINIENGKAVVATKAPIFGIAVKRDWTDAEHYFTDDVQKDKWHVGETLGALRKGGVSVPITADVNRYDSATVNEDGTFKPATTGDQVIGRFLTAGDAGSTAIVQVNITDMGPATTNPANNNGTNASQTNNNGSNTNSTPKKEGTN